MEDRLQLALLGGLRIEQNGTPLTDLAPLKGQALLCYLAVTRRPHSRAALAGLLWTELPEADARTNLRTVISKLHKLVAPHLSVTRETIAFNLAHPYWLDMEIFLDALRRAQAAPARDAVAALREAVALYRGDFLAGFYIRDAAAFEEWVVGERQYLRGLAVDALHRLAAAYTRQGNYAEAIDALRRLLALEPWREEAHYQLMQLLALSGQRSAALNQYDVMRRQLQAELGVAPEAESQVLYEQIRNNELRIEKEELRKPNSVSQFSILNSQLHDGAPDLGSFYGRTAELLTLRRWLVADGCRVVSILGMGGFGKTALAARLVGVVRERFERVIWRSLLNAPPLDEIVRTCIQALSPQEGASLPTSLDARLDLLMRLLRAKRCLLVFDNLESILEAGERAGSYRPGYADYAQLLARAGQGQHASCLLLTSREHPLELGRLEGADAPVRVLHLAGLDAEAGRSILRERGLGEQAGHAMLIERFSGNALALKLVASTIRDLFAGDVAAFLRDETPIFDDIRDVLDQQFARLSALERELLLWLAIEREPTTLPALQANLLQREPQRALLEALRSLQRRSLLEQQDQGFTLQNVVMEYTTDLLVTQLVRELETGELDLFARHALAKAQAREYVRQSQLRLILAPVTERLAARLGRENLLAKLRALPDALRARPDLASSYAAGNVLNLLIHLGADLRGLDLARLAVWQADLRGQAAGAMNFAGADLAGSAFTDFFQVAAAVAFSPDGQLLAAGTGSGAVRLWRCADGQPTALYEGHTAKVWSVAFSCDGRRLASASEDQTVRLWDVGSGVNYAALAGHGGWVRSVAFSPDGMLLASASDDHTLRLWDGHSGQALRVLEGHTSRVRAVAFAPDGTFLASAGADQTVRLWDSASGECLRVLEGHTSRVRAVAFSPTGTLLASASHDRTVRLWDVTSGQTVHMLQGHTDWVQALAFSPTGTLLASAGADQTVRLWDSASGRIQRILQGHQHSIEALAFHPSGTVLASGSVDQTVRLWDSATGRTVQLLYGYTQRMRAIAVSPDGATLASTGADQLVWLWDAHSRQPRTAVQANIGLVEALAFSPDGELLASAGERAVRLSDARTGTTTRIFHGHNDGVYAVAFNHDGTMLASASRDQSVRLWDMQTGTTLQILRGHRDWVKALAFSPDGALLVSGSDDQTVRVWDTAGDRPCLVLHGHTNSVGSVAFSPDGALLSSASADQTVCVWDVASGARRMMFSDHRNCVTTVAFSPDGALLASAGLDQIVRLWDLCQQRLRRTLHGHTGAIRSIAFSPDGALLVSGSDDETVRLWEVSTGRCVDILRAPGPYAGMNIASATGLTEAQRTALKALGAVER